MSKPFSFLLILLCVALVPAAPAAADRRDLEEVFDRHGVTGTMVVRQDHRTVLVNRPRAVKRFLPASTFKVPNALLAIDTGAVTGPEHPFPGPNPNFLVDGKEFLPAECEGDLTLATALRFSCIPIFQRIAREIGVDTYRRAMRSYRYGNRDVDGAPVDAFWLEGPFAISAAEQVRFLDRLRRGDLPASPAAIAGVQRMMITERTAQWTIHSKTGWATSVAPDLGWWVGWVDRDDARGDTTFALNLDIEEPTDAAARVAIGKEILRRLGAL